MILRVWILTALCIPAVAAESQHQHTDAAPMARRSPPTAIGYAGEPLAVPFAVSFSPALKRENGWDQTAKHYLSAVLTYGLNLVKLGKPEAKESSLFGWVGNDDALKGKSVSVVVTDETDPVLADRRIFPNGVPKDAEAATYSYVDPDTKKVQIRVLLLADRAGSPPEAITDPREQRRWVAAHLGALLGHEIYGPVQYWLARPGLPSAIPEAEQRQNALAAARASEKFLARLMANQVFFAVQPKETAMFLRKTLEEHLRAEQERIQSLQSPRS